MKRRRNGSLRACENKWLLPLLPQKGGGGGSDFCIAAALLLLYYCFTTASILESLSRTNGVCREGGGQEVCVVMIGAGGIRYRCLTVKEP